VIVRIVNPKAAEGSQEIATLTDVDMTPRVGEAIAVGYPEPKLYRVVNVAWAVDVFPKKEGGQPTVDALIVVVDPIE
jgi:hypothetical protein